MKINHICKQCNNSFEVDSRELTRKSRGKNQGNFCSRKCSANFNNSIKPFINHICIICSTVFQSKSKKAQYCSYHCQQSNKVTGEHRSYNLNKKINKIISTYKCFNCSWDLEVCDIHHVIERQDGGSNDLDNLVVVCPNCHRLIHRHKLDVKTIPTIKDKLEKNGGAGGIEAAC